MQPEFKGTRNKEKISSHYPSRSKDVFLFNKILISISIPSDAFHCSFTLEDWNDLRLVMFFSAAPYHHFFPVLEKGTQHSLSLVLDNSERLLYLTQCHSLLRPWWMGSECNLFLFYVS